MQFGFCVPPFANPGPAFFRTPAWTELEPARAVDAVVAAERLGYDSIWMADHLIHGHDGGILEGWTTLSVVGRPDRADQARHDPSRPAVPPPGPDGQDGLRRSTRSRAAA